MKITGKLVKFLPVKEGDTSKGHWVKSGIVVEYGDDYPKQVTVTVLGEEKMGMLVGHNPGDTVTVTAVPESRVYNGKWYTDLKMIRIE
jgi:hypothetical protein